MVAMSPIHKILLDKHRYFKSIKIIKYLIEAAIELIVGYYNNYIDK